MKYKVGQYDYCPKCSSQRAKIVWISEDGKTIAVQCPTSGHEHKRGTVMLMDIE